MSCPTILYWLKSKSLCVHFKIIAPVEATHKWENLIGQWFQIDRRSFIFHSHTYILNIFIVVHFPVHLLLYIKQNCTCIRHLQRDGFLFLKQKTHNSEKSPLYYIYWVPFYMRRNIYQFNPEPSLWIFFTCYLEISGHLWLIHLVKAGDI